MKLTTKKGQAAMEFLMTYGWAILVVLVVIGALSYFGVLSPSTLLPEKCTFPVGLSCSDFSVSASTINLIMLNGAGRDMAVWSINATADSLSGGPCTYTAPGTTGLVLRNGANNNFQLTTCTFSDTGRDKNRYLFNFSYSWLDSPTIKHTAPGELLGRKP